MDITHWEEPSDRRDNAGTARAVAETLKQNVGKWAIIEEHEYPSDKEQAKKLRAQTSNRASLIKQGRLAPFKPRGTFEALSRLVEIDEAGNSIEDGLVSTVGPGSESSVGDAPVGQVRKMIRAFARYRGEEYAQPEPERKPRKKKEEAAAVEAPAEGTPAADPTASEPETPAAVEELAPTS